MHLNKKPVFWTMVSTLAAIGSVIYLCSINEVEETPDSTKKPVAVDRSKILKKSKDGSVSLPIFIAGDESSLAAIKAAIKKMVETKQLDRGKVVSILDGMIQSGASEEEVNDFLEYVTQIGSQMGIAILPTAKDYINLASLTGPGSLRTGLLRSATSVATEEEIPQLTETWRGIMNIPLQRSIAARWTEKYFTKPDDQSIQKAFAFIEFTRVGDDYGRSLEKRNYAHKLAGEYYKKNGIMPSEEDFKRVLAHFSPRESVPLISYYAADKLEKGDLAALDRIMTDDADADGSALTAAVGAAKGIDPGTAAGILDRIPHTNSRMQYLQDLADAVKRAKGVDAATRFAREHYTASEADGIKLSE